MAYTGRGSGAEGKLTVSADATHSYKENSAFSGSAASPTLTVAAGLNISPGDVMFLHKTRGTTTTTPGTHEFAQVDSYSGTTVTLKKNLENSYQNSGDDRSQFIIPHQYSSIDINTGKSLVAPAWTTTTNPTVPRGGILILMCEGKIYNDGTLNAAGINTNMSLFDELGYVGGANTNGGGQPGGRAEGTGGARSGSSAAANGNGGGGGPGNVTAGGGGGGGNGGAGETPGSAQGGGISGLSDLTIITFGGGGGGGGKNNGSEGNFFSGQGGGGGGIIILICRDFENGPNGLVTVEAAPGSDSDANNSSGGGGGAAGSILIRCNKAILGTNQFRAVGGLRGAGKGGGGATGGSGGGGRIRIECGEYTGSIAAPYYAGGAGASSGTLSIVAGGFSWLGSYIFAGQLTTTSTSSSTTTTTTSSSTTTTSTSTTSTSSSTTTTSTTTTTTSTTTTSTSTTTTSSSTTTTSTTTTVPLSLKVDAGN